MKIIYDIDYKGEKAWAYELKNTENGKWYIGISGKKIDEYENDNRELMKMNDDGMEKVRL